MIELSVENLHLTYGDNPVLKGVSMDLKRGEVVSLLGPSGSGKTTLLRAVAGLEKPSQGRIVIGDSAVYNGSARSEIPAEERNLGLVFQSYALWPHKTVFENVAYPLKLRKTASAEIAQRVQAVLDQLGLGHLAKRHPHQLSGGQQQRVAIARAIAVRPKVLLLDEPLSALDAQIRHSMVEEIARLHRELPDLTILYVTHDQGEALTLADKIGIMRDGHLIAHGETRALYHHPTNRFAAEFLGRANLLPATALETTTGQGMTTVSCAGKVIGCFTYGAQRGFDKLLCIRPQHIALDADAQRSNCLIGTLRDIHWQGELTHLQFDAQGHPLRVVTTHRSRMPQIGERVPLYFAPDDAVLIED